MDIYNCPIETQLSAVQTIMREEYDKRVLHTVQQIGIDIDKEGLIEALNQDRKRYEEAYKKGWEDCETHYKEKLRRIAEEATL